MLLLHSRTRRHAWADWSRRAGRNADRAIGNEYEHFYFMLEAASAGLGVCIAPWPLVADDLRTGILVAPLGFIASGKHYVACAARASIARRRCSAIGWGKKPRAFGKPPA